MRTADGQFRTLYITTLNDTVYVLHCFTKKTQETSRHDIDIGRRRLRDLKQELRNG